MSSLRNSTTLSTTGTSLEPYDDILQCINKVLTKAHDTGSDEVGSDVKSSCNWFPKPGSDEWKPVAGVLAVLIVVTCLRRVYCTQFKVRALYVAGMDLLLLWSAQWHGNYFYAIMFGAVVIHIGMSIFMFYTTAQSDQPERLEFTRTLRNAIEEQSVFDNSEADLPHQIHLAALQLVLAFFFFYEVLKIVRSINTASVNYFFWCVACLLQMELFFSPQNDVQRGAPWKKSVIKMHQVLASAHTLQEVPTEGSTSPRKPQTMLCFCQGLNSQDIRRFWLHLMDFVVNCFIRDAIALALPLWLMFLETPMDFILSCVGVHFLHQLDDRKASETTRRTEQEGGGGGAAQSGSAPWGEGFPSRIQPNQPTNQPACSLRSVAPALEPAAAPCEYPTLYGEPLESARPTTAPGSLGHTVDDFGELEPQWTKTTIW